jgi:hypothetical protein
MLAPPVISLADPLLESEKSVDPLSLTRTHEQVADPFPPAVTLRMRRVRFLTARCLPRFAALSRAAKRT